MYTVFTIMESDQYIRKKGFVFALAPLAIFFILISILVYTNMLVLIPRFLEKKKTVLYTAGIICISIFYTVARSANQQYWDAQVWPDDIMSITDYVHWNFLYSIWFLIISSMLYYTHKWHDQRQQVKNIEITQLKTELKYLRAQVNPHFLFNGLNTIYGYIDMNNQQARNVLLQFSDLLRYSLYEADVDWVDLEKEAQYLQNYVDLQRARSNKNLHINLDIQVENKGIKIAPLIFMAFVENAFKFSTRDDESINTITISLQQKDNRIVFDCSNTYEDTDQPTGGIGLSNAKRRLELLYKDKYILNIKKENGIYSVQLIIVV